MHSMIGLFIALLLAFGSSIECVHAATPSKHVQYKWIDEQGGVHFSDSVPADAVKLGYDVLNSEGLTIRHVERAKTQEELKAAKAEARQKEELRRRADELVRADQQMLAAYPTESDLIHAQKAQIEIIEQNLHGAEINIHSLERSLTDLLSHAAELERNAKPLPPRLAQQISDLRNDIAAQKAFIEEKEKEKVDAAGKFEIELTHYRELLEKVKEQH